MKFLDSIVILLVLVYCTFDLGAARPRVDDVEKWCRTTGCPGSTTSVSTEFDEDSSEWICHCTDQSANTTDIMFHPRRKLTKRQLMMIDPMPYYDVVEDATTEIDNRFMYSRYA